MTAKEFLRQYRILEERIRQLDMAIMKLDAEYDSVMVDYSGMPHGSGIADRTAKLATRMTDLKEEKLRMRKAAVTKIEEIQRIIALVEDPILSKLLYDRYILFMTWEAIAEDCDRSEKWCRTELHSKALHCVKNLLDTSL